LARTTQASQYQKKHSPSTGHTNADIGIHANLELVDKFHYLGNMFSVDGDADAAVEART